MTSIEFFKTTEHHLEKLAHEKGISDLSRYYELTDYHQGSFLNSYSGMVKVFAQIAFHAQNATLVSNIVCFERNVEFLSENLCGFNPTLFCEEFKSDEREESVKKIVEKLRFNQQTGKGLKWNSQKSKSGKKDTIMCRYANTLIDAAEFLKKYQSRTEFLNALLKRYEHNNYKGVIAFFRNNISHGFSIALTCDFLKEFDAAFSDLPKPDIHIKDTLCSFLGHERNYYNTEKKELECIEDMQRIVKEINDALSQDKKITVYKFDRMIWLICSGNFYLDDIADYKNRYLREIKEEDK